MQPDFYKMDLDIEIEDDDLQVMTVKEIKQLDESYIEVILYSITQLLRDKKCNWWNQFLIFTEKGFMQGNCQKVWWEYELVLSILHPVWTRS